MALPALKKKIRLAAFLFSLSRKLFQITLADMLVFFFDFFLFFFKFLPAVLQGNYAGRQAQPHADLV
jgi:hypothetical protein